MPSFFAPRLDCVNSTLLALAAACSVGCSNSATLDLSRAANGTTVSVGVGDHINVTLQTIGPGEYESPSISSAAVRFTGMGDAGLPNPGGARQLFMFEATERGDATIQMAHTDQASNFGLTVNVSH
jgi:hypothetical protein